MAHRLAVEVDALRRSRQARLGLDEALEVLEGARRRQLQRQQLSVRRRARGGDGYGDAGPVVVDVLVVSQSQRVARQRPGQLTWRKGAAGSGFLAWMQVFLDRARAWYRVRMLRVARCWMDGGVAWDAVWRRLVPEERLRAPGEVLIRKHAPRIPAVTVDVSALAVWVCGLKLDRR
jgi:hypothetical protein